jgi:hypothetical protein
MAKSQKTAAVREDVGDQEVRPSRFGHRNRVSFDKGAGFSDSSFFAQRLRQLICDLGRIDERESFAIPIDGKGVDVFTGEELSFADHVVDAFRL